MHLDQPAIRLRSAPTDGARPDEAPRHRRRRLRRREPLRRARARATRTGRSSRFDNLNRRGSELNLPRLREAGVEFVHGDVREPRRPARRSAAIDAIVECSAEPSVLAGRRRRRRLPRAARTSSARYNCLELAPPRRRAARVPLDEPRLSRRGARARSPTRRRETRFELDAEQPLPGVSARGIAEDFPLDGRAHALRRDEARGRAADRRVRRRFGLRAVVDRCGVIAGPWQMGKVDQGVFTHWMLAPPASAAPLRYIGYGGAGKQVRDLLHVDDLVDLIDEQLAEPERWAGRRCNVGGGRDVLAVAARDDRRSAASSPGATVDVEPTPSDRPGDVPIYVSDCSRAVRAHRLAAAPQPARRARGHARLDRRRTRTRSARLLG